MDDPTTTYKAVYLMILIVVLTLIGISVLMGLRVTWTRFMARQNRDESEDESHTPVTDVWAVSGQRLIGQAPSTPPYADPFKRDGETGQPPFDDDEESNDDEFWRGSDNDDDDDDLI